MTDHYELLGVESDATKDEIKAAYRTEVQDADKSRKAQLNRAWNVLSDPVQRQRYDEQLHAGDGGDEGGAGTSTVPARRTTGARRGPDSALDSGGSGTNGSGGNGRGRGGGGGGGGGDDGDDDVPRRGGRPVPEPTVVLPAGMHLADKRQRGWSIGFDLSVLAVLYLVFSFAVIPAVLKAQYPNKVDRIDALNKQVDRLDKQKSNAEDREDKANEKADSTKNEDAKAEAKADAAAAKKDAKDH